MQAPAADRSIHIKLADHVREAGRQRGAASGVGTRRESVPGGSVAASMPPHGPAPGRGTTLPALLLLIGKQCVKHVLMSADSVADVISKPSIYWHVASDGDAPKDLQTTRPSAFLSATDNNRWCLRAWDLERHRCRATLSPR
ncbi:hypothetical protein XarCFBP6762_17475 [Xanthomonas arboricola]|nr:hypothetical protein XarCFBP6762_17475 [Xanthomonas arboricola]